MRALKHEYNNRKVYHYNNRKGDHKSNTMRIILHCFSKKFGSMEKNPTPAVAKYATAATRHSAPKPTTHYVYLPSYPLTQL